MLYDIIYVYRFWMTLKVPRITQQPVYLSARKADVCNLAPLTVDKAEALLKTTQRSVQQFTGQRIPNLYSKLEWQSQREATTSKRSITFDAV